MLGNRLFPAVSGQASIMVYSVNSHEPIYPRTCSDFANATGLVPIVAGSGTGSYRGISGDFHVALAVNEVEKKPCQPANGFQWQVITLAGHGTISHG